MIDLGLVTLKANNDQEQFTGNGKHLKVLLKALESSDMRVWNDFAKAQGAGFIADLSGINLAGEKLAGIELAHAKLAQANLDGCDLTGANLTGANLAGATLRNADLTAAKLKVASKVKAVRSTTNPEGQVVETEFPPEAYRDPALLRKMKARKLQEQAEALLLKRKQGEADKKLLEEKLQYKSRPGTFIVSDDD